MQSVELYSPNTPNLHLTSFASTHTLSEDVNPLNYQLTVDDFFALTQANGELLYTLDPMTTGSLFWALHRLARYISRATSHSISYDPSIPFASKGYIPQIFFNRIHMQCPDILTIQDHNFLNPLYSYTTRENLSAWYHDFQMIGRLTIQWIQTAQRQTLQLGPGTGWNWEVRYGPRLEYPECRLITDDTSSTDSSKSLFENTSEYSTDKFIGIDSDFMEENSGDEEKHIVLHPIKSAYAIHYPNFNPFAQRQLINNRYKVDDANNQCKAMIIHPKVGLGSGCAPINYMTTLFMARTNNMEE